MEVQTSATASCTLREIIDAVEPLRPGYALSGYQQNVLDCFGGKPGVFVVGGRARLNTLEMHKVLSPPLGLINFKHAELFLRFSRMGHDIQDMFLCDLCRLMWKQNIDRLEVAVQWSAHRVRHFKVERTPYGSMTGDRLELLFSMA